MHQDIERYLKRATRGLWGRKRKEVKEELSAHIQGRITTHRIAGLDETYAVQKTLQELGQPREVNSEMIRLHTLPTVLNLGTLAAIACAVTITFVSGSMAQNLQVAKTFPSPACLANPDTATLPWGDCHAFEVWTNVEALQNVLSPQGIEVKVRGNGNILGFRFDDGSFAALVPLISLANTPWFDKEGNELAEEYQLEPGYFSFWELLEGLVNSSSLPVTIEGWDDPTIQFGDASFTLGSTESPVDGKTFYRNYLTSIAFNPNQLLENSVLKDAVIVFEDGSSENLTTLQVAGLEPGDIYGVVTPATLEAGTQTYEGENLDLDLGLALDVTQADAEGTTTFELPSSETTQPLTFLEAFTGEPQPGTAVLVRLTGEARGGFGFNYEVVSPEQINTAN